MFFSNKLIFWKNAIFEKSEKIHRDSSKYYANLSFIIEVHTQKLEAVHFFDNVIIKNWWEVTIYSFMVALYS